MKRAALWVLGLSLSTAAHAEEFVVREGKPNLVVFESKAPTETFQGKTSRMSGSISVDPANLGDSATVRVEVDLASLDTGSKLRNKHMRENHLETSKFPKAVFEGVWLAPSQGGLEVGRPRVLTMDGTFTLHGVGRRVRLSVEVHLSVVSGQRRLSFTTNFPVDLSDYRISRPEFLFLKLAETQQVRVSGVGISASGGP